jgi:FlaG/FlaF family flagellin (archaellin)
MFATKPQYQQFDYKMKKRALSAVIATVLLILFTVVAIVIIAAIIIPFANNYLEESSSCVEIQNALKFDASSNYNCYEIDELENFVSIKAFNVSMATPEFTLSFISEGTAKTVTINEDRTFSTEDPLADLTMLDGSLDIYIPKPGEISTYSFKDGETYEKVELHPITSMGKSCETSDSIDLKICRI